MRAQFEQLKSDGPASVTCGFVFLPFCSSDFSHVWLDFYFLVFQFRGPNRTSPSSTHPDALEAIGKACQRKTQKEVAEAAAANSSGKPSKQFEAIKRHRK